jgi:hypothetical protein
MKLYLLDRTNKSMREINTLDSMCDNKRGGGGQNAKKKRKE